MPACLAECSFYLRNKVAVDRPTESQVAALDSSTFPKAAPPGTSRASGVSKFFENIKPLSDFFGETLNAAGSLIARLFDSDKPIIECGISVAVRKEVGSHSNEQYSALVESHSVSEQHNEILTSAVASPSSAQPKPSVLENTTSEQHNEILTSAVASSSSEQPRPSVLEDATSEQHNEILTSAVASPSSEQPRPSVLENTTSEQHNEILTSAVASSSSEQPRPLVLENTTSEQHNEILTSAVASPSSEQPRPSVLEDATPACSSQVRDDQGRDLHEEWEGALFNGPSEDDLRNFEKLLTSSGHAQEYTSTWTYV